MKKSETYYLIKDILSCFPHKVEENLVYVLRSHKSVKDVTKIIFKEEILKESPSFNVLMGSLILYFNYLRSAPKTAFYEVLEVIEELDYCFKKDSRKTIKKLSSKIILILFLTLYSEFRIMPLRNIDDEKYVNYFKRVFSIEDMNRVIMITDKSAFTRWIFEHFGGVRLGMDRQKSIDEVFDRFWN